MYCIFVYEHEAFASSYFTIILHQLKIADVPLEEAHVWPLVHGEVLCLYKFTSTHVCLLIVMRKRLKSLLRHVPRLYNINY